ncbi:transcriptional regulator [Lactobacillus amylovorus DSM 20531]|nr:RNA-binding domain-containing protein [Lactobacillus amylovorus]ATO53408.1 transcriptional regulator [Lactobacillus amylovorus DSM 20531]KRK42582.1 transcriptional regulator [Lactobacillus amylovorus DSM 20531]MCT3592776.1 transcriptional regulator [Lactobacillus amylovorus]
MDFINFVKDVGALEFTIPKEDLHLEFKTASWKLPQNIWETVSSFSNTDGGLIVLGVDEPQSHHYKIVGVDQPDDVIKELFNSNNNPTVINKPVIQDSDVKVAKFDGKTLIQIRILPAQFSDKPITYKDKTYMRSDDGDRLATHDQLKYLYAESQDQVDTRLLENFDWDSDLNLEDINDYRKKLEKVEDADSISKSDYELLTDIGVLRRDRRSSSKERKLTEGGLLFLVKFMSIMDRFPRFQLDYTRYAKDGDTDWVDRVSAGDMNYPEMNIYSFYNIVLPKITSNINDKYIQDEDLTRGSYVADLRSAAKEALVNCLMHAYYDGTIAIQIEDRPSYWEFTNPGDMRVSRESFLRGQKSEVRNSEIATLFRRIGISEKRASGGPRILRAASRNHLMEPEIEIDATNKITKIRIWKIDIRTKIDDEMVLDPTEKFIIDYAIQKSEFSFSQMFKDMNDKFGSNSTVRKRLNHLIDEKILISEGNGKSTVYKLEKTSEQEQVDKIMRLKNMEEKL